MTDRAKIEAVVAGIVTREGGEILLARKPENADHLIAGEWHFPGGYVEGEEEPEEALKREIREETGLEVEIHHLVDCYRVRNGDLRMVYHVQAEPGEAEPMDDVEELQWVGAGDLENALEGTVELEDLQDRERTSNMIEKLQKMPVWNR